MTDVFHEQPMKVEWANAHVLGDLCQAGGSVEILMDVRDGLSYASIFDGADDRKFARFKHA